MIVAPNSPIPRAKASAAPAPSPPAASGRAIAEEDSAGPGAERSGGSRERRVDSFEGGDGRTDVERACDERDRQDDRDLREGDIDTEGLEGAPEQPEPSERDEQADACDGGR